MDREALEQFIEDNHRYFTVAEIIEHTGAKPWLVNSIVQKGGYKVITITERAERYINSHMHLSFNQLMEKLDVAEATMNNYLKKMGLKVKPKDRDKPMNTIVIQRKDTPQKQEPVISRATIIAMAVTNQINRTVTLEQLASGNNSPSWVI